MRLGILADIHSHYMELALALQILRVQGVDGILTLGDSIEAFGCPHKAGYTADLLLEYGVQGVWGNHDMPLCVDPNQELQEKFPASVFEFTAKLLPSIDSKDNWIAHREPSTNPTDLEAMWGLPSEGFDLGMLAAGELANNFDRFMMVGHYHRWFAATAAGPLEWKGDKKLFISNKESIFLVIAPVFSGFCAVLDIQKDSDGEKITLEPYEFTIVPE